MNLQDSLTKAYTTQRDEEVHIVPGIPSPTIEEGTATFYYRDKELYLADQMDQIEKVELAIDNQTLEMDYEANNERYVYMYEDFPEGEFDYTFIRSEERRVGKECRYWSSMEKYKKRT